MYKFITYNIDNIKFFDTKQTKYRNRFDRLSNKYLIITYNTILFYKYMIYKL